MKRFTLTGCAQCVALLAILLFCCACGASSYPAESAPGDAGMPPAKPQQTIDEVPPEAELLPHHIDGQVEKSAAVEPSYFDDAVFIGDSITAMLRQYEAATGALGQAQFLCAASLSANNALMNVSEESVHPYYNGAKMRLEDAVPLTGAKKVYIMLGMNDIAREGGKEHSLECFEQLCDLILANVPDAVICVQSVTPRLDMGGAPLGDLNNPNITAYNEMLAGLCQRRGWYFVNVAEVMFDDNGYLNVNYCGDPQEMGMHYNYDGCEIWADYLLTHTPQGGTDET